MSICGPEWVGRLALVHLKPEKESGHDYAEEPRRKHEGCQSPKPLVKRGVGLDSPLLWLRE
jgi:hypothetical protein